MIYSCARLLGSRIISERDLGFRIHESPFNGLLPWHALSCGVYGPFFVTGLWPIIVTANDDGSQYNASPFVSPMCAHKMAVLLSPRREWWSVGRRGVIHIVFGTGKSIQSCIGTTSRHWGTFRHSRLIILVTHKQAPVILQMKTKNSQKALEKIFMMKLIFFFNII